MLIPPARARTTSAPAARRWRRSSAAIGSCGPRSPHGMEGKDGNPLNEVRMLCDPIEKNLLLGKEHR